MQRTRIDSFLLVCGCVALWLQGCTFSQEAGPAPEFGRALFPADELYARMDWKWFTNPQTRHPYLACFPEDDPPREPHGGRNEEGFFSGWAAYSEHMFLYILGAGAPNPAFATGADSHYATQLIWRLVHQNEHIQRGLKRLEFRAINTPP